MRTFCNNLFVLMFLRVFFLCSSSSTSSVSRVIVTFALVTTLMTTFLELSVTVKAEPEIAEVNNNRLLNAINGNDGDIVVDVLRECSKKQLNKRGSGGQTPLMFAVMNGKEKAVLPLLQAGADFSVGDDSGYTPIHGAAFQGHSQIVLSLIEFGVPFINEYHADGRTPFHRACWGESKAHAQTVKIFLQAGADIDQEAKSGHLCSQLTANRHTQKVLRLYRKKQKGHLYRDANSQDALSFSYAQEEAGEKAKEL